MLNIAPFRYNIFELAIGPRNQSLQHLAFVRIKWRGIAHQPGVFSAFQYHPVEFELAKCPLCVGFERDHTNAAGHGEGLRDDRMGQRRHIVTT